MRTLFISWISLFLYIPLQAQVIHFDVIFEGNSIGTLTASKEVKGTQAIKNLRSNTDAKILMLSIHVESEVHVQSEGEILTSATAYRHANRGSEDIETTVNKQNGTYTIVKNGQTSKLVHAGIKFCITDLYFKEPLGINTVFSNTYGVFLKIIPKGNGMYSLTLPDGKVSVFTYSGGKLVQVDVSISVGSVLLKRK